MTQWTTLQEAEAWWQKARNHCSTAREEDSRQVVVLICHRVIYNEQMDIESDMVFCVSLGVETETSKTKLHPPQAQT